MPRPRFRNPWPHPQHGLLDILRWKLGLPPYECAMIPDAPEKSASLMLLHPDDIATPPFTGWRVTWLGHASFLLQGAGLSLLIDPIFSSHCAPVKIPMLRRLVTTPCQPHELPRIDAVLLTHSHFDHLDLPTLRMLGRDIRLVTPAGHAAMLKQAGFPHCIELAWHESMQLDENVRVAATPAQHFTARTPWNRDQAHWCGWLVEGASCKLWHAGDSGYCEAFREIGEHLGPIDIGMIPIGAYQPRHIMRSMHMNPEEAVKVFLETRCRRAVAMHWGTFRLTDEPLGEPPLLLSAALEKHGIPAEDFIAGKIGQSWTVLPAG